LAVGGEGLDDDHAAAAAGARSGEHGLRSVTDGSLILRDRLRCLRRRPEAGAPGRCCRHACRQRAGRGLAARGLAGYRVWSYLSLLAPAWF